MRQLLLVLLVALFSFAFDKSVEHPKLLQQGPAKMWCSVCGMNLAKFFKTNYAAISDDNTTKEYCSMHCLAADFAHIKPHLKKLLAVDAKSGKWIDAKSAWYVVGSKVPGTMSRVSKLAFATKKEAEEFAKRYGGKVMGFDEAFALAKKSLAKEERMIQAKRHKMARFGHLLYHKRCHPIDQNFTSVAKAKAYIKTSGACKGLNPKQLQAVALYLVQKSGHRIHVPKNAKCPVCGMFVAKYPRWATMIVDASGHKVYFDGVKDMMRYIQNHPFKRAYVSDYYSGQTVDATKAWYVLGSDVTGPMGKELIPFGSKEEALRFMKDHRGQKVLGFSQITPEVLKSLE